MESKRLLMTDKMKDWILTNYAYLSGGKTSSGSYIITFPDVGTSQTSSSHAAADKNVYAQLFRYLCSTVQNETLEVKFTLIIDRRLNRWANVKSLFTSLQECTSEYNSVERIYLLQPSGLYNSLSKLFLFNVDESKDFKTLSVTLEELHKHINQSQLTVELGGTLTINLDEWISDRKMLEALMEYNLNIKKNFEAAIDNNMNNQIKSSSSTSFSSSIFTIEISLEDIIVRSQSRVNALQSLVGKSEGCISNAVASLAYLNHESNPLKFSHIIVMESLDSSIKTLKLNIEEELGQQKSYLNKLLTIQTCGEGLDTVRTQVEKCNTELNEVLNDEDEELINSYQLENPDPQFIMKIYMLATRMGHIDEIKALLPVFDSISLDIHNFSHQRGVHNIEQLTALNNLTAILFNERRLLEETLHQMQMKVKDKIKQIIRDQIYLSFLNENSIEEKRNALSERRREQEEEEERRRQQELQEDMDRLSKEAKKKAEITMKNEILGGHPSAANQTSGSQSPHSSHLSIYSGNNPDSEKQSLTSKMSDANQSLLSESLSNQTAGNVGNFSANSSLLPPPPQLPNLNKTGPPLPPPLPPPTFIALGGGCSSGGGDGGGDNHFRVRPNVSSGAVKSQPSVESSNKRESSEDLLTSIRNGFNLRKVNEVKQEVKNKNADQTMLSNLQNIIEMRRRALEEEDDDDGDYDDADGDNDWAD